MTDCPRYPQQRQSLTGMQPNPHHCEEGNQGSDRPKETIAITSGRIKII